MEREDASIERRKKLLVGLAGALLLYSLIGFFLAPWLVKRIATDQIVNGYGASLTLDKVAINPFVLSLQLDGVGLTDPEGQPLAAAEQIFVNVQLSSLFNWALTLAEFRLTAPRLDLARDAQGQLNVDFLLAGEESAPSPSDEAPTALPRFLIHNLIIDQLALNWRDTVNGDPVTTRLGPASIAIEELNTLPDRSGNQTVAIESDDFGSLNWSGSISLNPFFSSGQATVSGANFTVLSAYLRHDLGFDIQKGSASATFDYTVSLPEGGDVSASINDFELVISALEMHTLHPPDDFESRVLSLPALKLNLHEVLWPEQVLTADSLVIEGGNLNLLRDTDNLLNLMPRNAGDGGDEVSAKPAGEPWALSLARFQLANFAVDFEDRAVSPYAKGGLANIDFSMEQLNNQPGSRFPTALSFEGHAGGRVALEGQLEVLPAPEFQFQIRTEQAGLKNLQPYVAPLADMEMTSGTLDLEGELRGGADQPLFFDASLIVADLELTETKEGARLGSWQAMSVDRITVDLADNNVQISEVRFERPYAEVVITESGTLNVARINKDPGHSDLPVTSDAKKTEGAAAPTGTANQGASVTEAPAPDEALAVTIGRVVLDDAAVDFSDFSLPIPFAANITRLNGDMTTISTVSSEPSTLNFEGAVDEFGMVRVTGALTPLEPSRNTDVKVAFQNIEIPKFTSYSIPFAGREISEGRLKLNLDYTVDKGQLLGKNSIVISEFELGQEVPHPDATSLPLELAVALLKDVEGNIDLDLPVSGDINDPEFSYGGIVGRALANLIVKIVASPFMLLGNLVGMDAGELDNLNFYPGRYDLTPPELEKIGKLAEALNLRPELSLTIPPTVTGQHDRMNLQRRSLEAKVAGILEATQDDDALYADRRQAALESLYREAFPGSQELEALQATFTTTAEGDGEPQFDSLAYTTELEGWLVELQSITDLELETLGQQRADSVQTALLQANPAMGPRILIVEPVEVAIEADDTLKMPISLSAQHSETP